MKNISGLKGKRVLIIYGLDHKYFIEDFLGVEKQNVVNAESFYKTSEQNFVVDPSLKKKTLDNVSGAKHLLEKRLSKGYYSKDFSEQLTHKAKEFDVWINYLESLN